MENSPDKLSIECFSNQKADKLDVLSGSTDHVEQVTDHDFDDSIEDTEPSRAVWLITFTVAMGGFLFGSAILKTSFSSSSDSQ